MSRCASFAVGEPYHRTIDNPSVRHQSQAMRKLRIVPLAVLVLFVASCSEITAPPPPDVLELAGTAQVSGIVGSDHPLSIRLTDAAGRPIANGAVRWNVGEGSGTVSPAVSMTDATGLAVATWTLSERPGTYRVLAESEWIQPVEFVATAMIGPAAEIAPINVIPERAVAGASITTSFVVRDRFGNPVAGTTIVFEVVEGGGTLEGDATVTSDVNGVATLRNWRLGRTIGVNRLRAVVDGMEPLMLTIQGDPFSFSVEGVHLNQGSQRANGSIGGVTGRAGLLRVLLRAAGDNDYRPDVLVRLFEGNRLIREVTVAGTQAGIPTRPNLGSRDDTWNIVLSAEDVVEDLRVEVIADPRGEVPDTDVSDNRWPRGAGAAPLDVRSLAPFRIVVIPVNATFHSREAIINPANVEEFLADTRKWIPAGEIEYSFRPAFTSSANLTVTGDWSRLLSEIQSMRTAEGARDEYYHGIVPAVQNVAIGGLAYRPTSPQSQFRSGLSYDRLPAASATIAHELGHNLGRPHAPCGNPANVDAAFPHLNGIAGEVGYDILLNTLANADAADYMSYCSPRWTSDYTYDLILDWRRGDPLAVWPGSMAAKAPVAPLDGLLIWGRMNRAGAELYPSFRLSTLPSLPTESGPNVVRGLSADGREVFRLNFAGTQLGHGPDHSEQHFNFFVPLSPADIDAVARIELVTGSGGAELSTAIGASKNDNPAVRARPGSRGRVRVQWDATRAPMIMVRDASTGYVVAFGRGGDAEIDLGGRSLAGYEVLVSSGVGSRRARIE
jgi:hypothetical protein